MQLALNLYVLYPVNRLGLKFHVKIYKKYKITLAFLCTLLYSKSAKTIKCFEKRNQLLKSTGNLI